MNQDEKINIVRALKVAFEVMGQDVSKEATEVMASRLFRFEYPQVKKAIGRAIDECKYKITVAEIISRIDDGRPSPEKAWQEVESLTEDDAAVLTTEQNQAFCGVSTSLIDGDTSAKIAARQAFIQEYEKLCKESRDQGRPVSYFLSRAQRDFGHQKALEAVASAVNTGKLPKQKAIGLLPQYAAEIEQGIMIEHKPETDVAGFIGDVAENMKINKIDTKNRKGEMTGSMSEFDVIWGVE